MIGLLFKINGDSSGFAKEMDKTKKVANSSGHIVAKEFGTQFKGALMSFIGGGAIVGAIKKMVSEALRVDEESLRAGLGVEAFQELERAAKATGLTVDEIRESAPEAAKEFAALMESIKEKGGILDKATVQQLSDASAELSGALNAFTPLLVAAVKYINMELGKLLGGGKAIAGSVLPFMQVLGFRPKGADQKGEALVDAGMKQAESAQFGQSAFGRNTIRERGEQLRSALRANRQAVATARRDDAVTGSMMREIPFLGGVTKDLIDGMWTIAEEQKRTRAELSKRL